MIKGSNLVFQNVDLLDYKLHRVRLRRGESCIKSPKWLLHKEATINLIKLFMVEEGTRGGIWQAIHRYAKANNKYMENYDKDIISSYLMYLDANNLYGWAMSQKLPVNSFKWVKHLSKFNEVFIRNYDKTNDKGYFLEVDFDYPKNLFDLHKELPFLAERKKVNKVEKLICNTEDKEKYVMHIKVLKQVLNHGLVLKKVHRVINLVKTIHRYEY